MKNKGQTITGSMERDEALMDFVNYQAQEAILNPTLPESYKDEVLEAAVGTIQKVAERKAVYYAKYGEGRRTRKPHVIYEAPQDESEDQENTPSIIAELNENLKKDTSTDTKDFTVEWIAERAGISKNILYEWAGSDTEFTTALETLKEAQKNDPFKTGAEEDTFVNAMMIALVLLETKDRKWKNYQ
jgi:hypothetical protein